MKNFSLLLALLLILAACGDKDKKHVTLHGHIEGIEQDTLYLYGADLYYDRIDTLLVKNGNFSATLQVDTLISTRLLFKDGTHYPLYLDKGNQISIKGNSKDLHCLEITGNPTNVEMTAFQQELKNVKEPTEQKKKAEAFIRTHPFSLVSLYLLDTYFVQQPQPDIKLIRELITGLSGELKDRPYLDNLEEEIKNQEKTQTGRNLPYFRLPNEQGVRKSRSDFKDKYLLLHFWASWDTVSCRQNAIYRRIYQQERKNKHFALVGISLDINPEDWKKSIKQDTLKWEQLCDFGSWKNSLVEQLGIQAVPCNFLISPNGTITDKNLDEQAILKKIKAIEAETKNKKEDFTKRTKKKPSRQLPKEPEKGSLKGELKTIQVRS